MSNKMIINNEKISEYLGTEDAIKGLQKVVDNGQTRLALEVVFDIITQLTDKIYALEEILSAKEDVSLASAPVQAKQTAKIKEAITEVLEEEKK